MSTRDSRKLWRKDYARRSTAVEELDAYIAAYENSFGKLKVRKVIPNGQPEISRSLKELKYALTRNHSDKREAYENLKQSNETMKEIIAKLQYEMKTCKEGIRTEFANFENLNTERLLDISPKYFVHCTARQQ